MTSRVPDIMGHFPLTTTFVLRLLQLAAAPKQLQADSYASKAIKGLIGQPLLYLGGERFQDQVSHHLRFSIEYLRREGFLNKSGNPIDLAGCVSHLFYIEVFIKKICSIRTI